MMELLTEAKDAFSRSNVDKKHPFRYFTLVTFGEAYPEARTVVSRGVDKALQILVFTDARSLKVAQIQKNNQVSALFYHPKQKLQVRVQGEAHLIDENHQEYATYLHQVRSSPSLLDYTTSQAPGSVLENDAGDITHGEHLHFLAIQVIPHQLDVLKLDRVQHQRARYAQSGKGWIEQRLVP
ncbi:MAG TPA: hypothetical protein DCS93_09280 [Microscillaceae bacterium]|nr:hypothetical protein [Microscillaceae bacterium]